jgi:thiol-disulfide isomerase/thioredoxin
MTLLNFKRITVLAAISLLLAGCSGSSNEAGTQCETAKSRYAALDQAVSGEIAAMRILDEPVRLAGISFLDGNGEGKSLEDFTGKSLLVNIWATWCAPCRKEMPAFDALQAEFGNESFEVVAISVDKGESDKPKAFFEEIGISHLGFYHDGTMEAFNLIRKDNLALGLPVTLLIDGSNCVVGTLNGPAEWQSEDAKKLVRTLLGS